MSDIDNMLDDLLKSLVKKEAPIVARIRRKILKQGGLGAAQRKKITKRPNQFGDGAAYKSEVITTYEQPLAKNEYEAVSFEDGNVKMQFGSEIPELVKKRAMDWAKKRGFKIKEMSLDKNSESGSWVIFGK